METVSQLSADKADITYVNQQVQKAAPRNLLNNSDFRNPVNQRGQTSYTTSGHTIDRWWCNGTGELSVNDGNISSLLVDEGSYFDIVQTLENADVLTGRIMTFAIKTQEYGVLLANFTFGANEADLTGDLELFNYLDKVYIRNHKMELVHIEWAALYEGEYTLETLPEYQSKGYGAELAECRRYFRRLKGDPMMSAYVGSTNTMLYVVCPEYREMRTSPTVVSSGKFQMLCDKAFYTFEVVSARLDDTVAELVVVYDSGSPPAVTDCVIYAYSAYLQLSADL